MVFLSLNLTAQWSVFIHGARERQGFLFGLIRAFFLPFIEYIAYLGAATERPPRRGAITV